MKAAGNRSPWKIFARCETGDKLVLAASSCLFLGFIPWAPGTFGSLAGIVLYLFASRFGLFVNALIIMLAAIPAVLAAHRSGMLYGQTDASHIVIDEAMGMAVSLFSIRPDPAVMTAAFLLFRLFDIWKPFPIRYAEKKVPGGLGVVADDILAGIYANMALHLGVILQNIYGL